METKNKKKKDRKPLYILAGVVTLFILFVYFLSGSTTENKAIEEIQICTTMSEVKALFDKYKFELLQTNDDGEKEVTQNFQLAVRNKLNSFDLTEEEIQECIAWLPQTKKNLNIIVVPDLSNRVQLISNQVQNDKLVLNTIWNSFQEVTKFKQDSRDNLIIDTTDPEQAKGQFYKIANNLQHDLSKHMGKSNRLYFSEGDKSKIFTNSINYMYQSAVAKPIGADYVFYFKRYLQNRIKKNTLFESYKNKVVIITDGYLESTSRPADTKLTPQLYKSLAIGNTKEMITLLGLNIPKCDVDLSNTDVMVCEVNERKTGLGKDYDILKAYWTDWLSRMQVKKIDFIAREQATDLTVSKVDAFIKK